MFRTFLFSVLILLLVLQEAKADSYSDSLRVRIQSAQEPMLKAELLLQLAKWYIEVQPDSTLRLISEAEEILKDHPNPLLLCDAYRGKGAVLRFKGEYREALYWFRKALKSVERSGDFKRMAYSLNNIGLVYWDLGNYVLAIDHLLKAMQIHEAMKNDDGMLSASINLGLVYDYQEKYEFAMKYYKQAESIALRINDRSSLSLLYNNIGYVYIKSKNYYLASEYIHSALHIAAADGYFPNLGYATNNMGVVHADLDNMDSAQFYMDSSLRVRTMLGDQFGIAMCYLNFGKWEFKKGNLKKAEEWLLQAQQLAETTGSKVVIMDVSQALAEVYLKGGNYKKAYEFHDRYYTLRDSVSSEESRRKTVEMKSEFELKKKQDEIDLVKKDAEIDRIARESAMNRQRIIIWASVGGIILVLGFLVSVYRQFRLKKKANEEITLQKLIIEEKNKEILDSIHYAKRIQRALLASETLLKRNLVEYFVVYLQKDIVSGDFYWASNAKTVGENSGQFFFCIADCTGHGVPGAFMSLLNISKLNEVISERGERVPSVIFDKVRDEIIASLNQEGAEEESKDGMDAVLISLDTKTGILQLACANNPVWIIRSGELLEIKPDKMPVGTHHGNVLPFTRHQLQLQKGDMVYLFTDGYADQFGGPKGKKFKYSQFAEILKEIAPLPTEQQQKILEERIIAWRGHLEQNDDILVAGFRY